MYTKIMCYNYLLSSIVVEKGIVKYTANIEFIKVLFCIFEIWFNGLVTCHILELFKEVRAR